MKQPRYEVHEPDILTLRAAELLAWTLTEAVAARGVAHIALSGGSTPRPLFKLLASPDWQERIPWAHTHIWWVDERCVPPDDPNSNYGVTFALLLQHLPVVISHRIHGEEPPWRAVWLYEQELATASGLMAGEWPRFDLILLGMGPDGHTASLFPGTPALAARERFVTVGHAPTPPVERVTLTLPVLNRAATIIFLAAGESKGPALTALFHEDDGQPPLPASLVQPQAGQLLWLLDASARAAAGLDMLQAC